MDTSTHNQQDASQTPPNAEHLTLDVMAVPDPSALVTAHGAPLLQLRALEHAGDPELQREFFKIFLSDDAAVQVQALLRLEEGDTGLDLLYPPQAPNWALRAENLPDTGTRFTRLDVDSRLATSDTLTITADEAAGLAEQIEVAVAERERQRAEMLLDGDESGESSGEDPAGV